MNRRELAKGLAAGLAVGKVGMAQGAAGEAGWVRVMPGVWKASIGTAEAFTPVKGRLVEAKVDGLKAMGVLETAPLGAPVGRVTGRGCLVALPLAPEEMLYGFGLQLLSFGQRGKKKVMRVNADPRLDSGDSHAPVPFYVSTRGYGVFVDTARHVEFDCGNARLKPTRAMTGGATGTPDENETHGLAMVDKGRVLVEVPRVEGVDVYLFAGPSMMEAVRRYNLFSGGGVEPPAWGLGFWYRAYGKGTQATVTKQMQDLRAGKIPCDVFGLEPGWQSHSYSCSFIWNNEGFPDPEGLLATAKGLNLKVNLWEHAYVHPTSPLFAPLEDKAGDYGVWGGLVPDFAGEPARKIFGDFHGRTLIDKGISGFKLDECDGSDFTGSWSFPDFSRFPSGVDGEQMHAVFGLRYQAAIWQQFRDRKIETYGLVRSSGALAAPYPFVLYSDLYDHRQFVRGVVTAGFSGLLWCPEVRDASSEEDLIRRLQSVVFSPLAMVNAWYIQNPPWMQMDREKNNRGEIDPDAARLEAKCREIIGWRMMLVPYLRAAFARYAEDGTPPFRALVMDAPGEKALWGVDDSFWVGDRMIVSPLFAGEASRKVVLPKGEWCDFWTGKAVEGGVEFVVGREFEKIPVYVKGGSVFPVAGVGDSAESGVSRELTVRVFGDGALGWRFEGMELGWSGGKGVVTGRGGYRVVGWERMGG
jgi:alpha-D-xyloside xylohydrolase